MKRGRESESVLKLELIITEISKVLLSRYLEGKKLTRAKTFKLKIYSDSTLTNGNFVEVVARRMAYICDNQYHLLRDLHPEVLKKRASGGFSFIHHDGTYVCFECSHLSLTKVEDQVLEWEFNIYHVEKDSKILLNYYK